MPLGQASICKDIEPKHHFFDIKLATFKKKPCQIGGIRSIIEA
jgi:hypothetical protein